ncbi:Rieske iron-sulfur domain-containing protein [Burkholderia lata]|uniref:aromatic ring-hydroxylating oxygenase subunit alpha n=1 Tax=Burkholderia lata (strain ATCC 17760 / DSM 23089 / LMG 22485 / NCIMB 9086 / R18194 / 383) TaxID=482957 RepID=UPI001452B7C0|nr:Rieske 2Fe-2S domain-containing protein [Burkholderia lata]VWD04442.1 Rieske iron-sulfur domain-containing protein [Burkholderia lata]
METSIAEQLPLPFGWYFIACGSDVEAGRVSTVRFFGQEWVLFRNADGAVGVLDPYCPHLGAHIGDGKIDGSCIRCPFHNWAFDEHGTCMDIPYAQKRTDALRNRARIKHLPVVETNGIVWAWFHPASREPLWPVADLLVEFGSIPIVRKSFVFHVKAHIQEILENSVDYAHLVYVHGHKTNFNGENCFDGIGRVSGMAASINFTDPKGRLISSPYSIKFSQTGPGQAVVRYQRVVDVTMLFLVSPVSEKESELRFFFYHEDVEGDQLKQSLIDDFMQEKVGRREGLSGVFADIPIWERKIYRKHPLLCDGDGPIMQFRSWFRQFYYI